MSRPRRLHCRHRPEHRPASNCFKFTSRAAEPRPGKTSPTHRCRATAGTATDGSPATLFPHTHTPLTNGLKGARGS
ncbi:hypothetical protein AV530_001613 [Patagioenas fasciata monilis]|uniref:Uncharacterized protein n=1 Tax=Patagioenas fasciata monilis TaxID=372326 RepID=A0A1V4K519_PATFA|nr:hypothetical protein AV530_001613 [Patagioenas fasciata monilis]